MNNIILEKRGRKFSLYLVAMLVFFTTSALPLCSADTFGNYPINTNVNLIFSCQNSTYLNISKVIVFPNSTLIINQELSTTKSGNTYNYTIAAINNSLYGTYVVSYHCDVSGIDTPSVSSYEISNSGYQLTTGNTILMFLGLGIVAMLALLFFYFGMKAEDTTIKIFTLGMAVLFVVVLFGLGYNILNLIAQFPSLSSSINAIYILMTILLICAGAGLILWLISFVLNLWWKHRGFRD